MSLKTMINELDSLPKTFSVMNLQDIYIDGQEQIWSSSKVLASLNDFHGFAESKLSKTELTALKNILSLILWGELAAWKVSLALADEIPHLEPKLAATSQAHDEARHFLAMKGYLEELGGPVDPNTITISGLNRVLQAPTLVHKLVGMQLMVEPVAMAIFQALIQKNVSPKLSELLTYFMRDEARHIRLGTNYLPYVIQTKSKLQMFNVFAWQTKTLLMEIDGLKALEDDFMTLSIHPKSVFSLAKQKQIQALHSILEETNLPKSIASKMEYLFEIKMKMTFEDKTLFEILAP